MLVGAQGEHVLAEGGLVPDEPHEGGADQGDPHVVGNGRAADLQQGAGDKAGVALVKARNGHAVVLAGLDVQQQNGVDDQLGSQGDDEGMQLVLGHKEAVEGADGTADDHGQDQHQQNRRRGQVGPHLAGGVHGLEEGRGDAGGQAHDAAGAQVGTGQHDASADAQGHRQVGAGLGQDVDDGSGLEEVLVDDGDVDDGDHHDDDQGVVENGVQHALGSPGLLGRSFGLSLFLHGFGFLAHR